MIKGKIPELCPVCKQTVPRMHMRWTWDREGNLHRTVCAECFEEIRKNGSDEDFNVGGRPFGAAPAWKEAKT